MSLLMLPIYYVATFMSKQHYALRQATVKAENDTQPVKTLK